MSELLKALGPVRWRLRLRRFVKGAGTGFAAGALAALVLLAVTSFVPLKNRWLIAAACTAGSTLLAGAGCALWPVKPREAALAADACGLQERSVTALELAGKQESEMILFQRRDACDSLNALDTKQIRPDFPRRQVILGAVLLVLCAGTLLLPGGGDRAVAARQALEQKTAAMARKADEAAAADEAGLTEKEKAELRKLTEDLKRDLNASRDELDAMVALDKAEQQLEKLRSEQMRDRTAGDAMEAMDALSQAMQGAGMDPGQAQSLSEAMESGNAAAMNASLSELDAEQLKKLAEGLSGDAKSLAEQLAQAAEAGEITDAQLQAMMSGSQSAAQGSNLQQAISGMKASLGAGGTQSGSQSGQSAGTGAGNNQGMNGAGAGTGTTNEEQKGGGSSGQKNGASGGNRPPEFKQGEYETIYDPEKAETASRDVMTEQNSLGKDSVQIETGPGKGTLEGDVPFRQVVGEYAEQEAKAAESAHLTKEQKDWVDEYFRRLTDDQ